MTGEVFVLLVAVIAGCALGSLAHAIADALHEFAESHRRIAIARRRDHSKVPPIK